MKTTLPTVQIDNWSISISLNTDEKSMMNYKYSITFHEEDKPVAWWFPLSGRIILWKHFNFNVHKIPQKVRLFGEKLMKLNTFI